MSKALTKEHVRKHYSSGAVAYYESGAPVRMMTPEESAYAAQRFDEWLAEVERAAAARALEEFADQMTTGFNAGTLNAERRAIKREARARAAEIRGGERHEVL